MSSNSGDEKTLLRERRHSPARPSSPRAASTSLGQLAVPSSTPLYGRRSPRTDDGNGTDDALSDASRDSFDWFGDERVTAADVDEEEEEDLEVFLKTDGKTSGAGDDLGQSFFHTLLPKNFSNDLLLAFLVGCCLVWLLGRFSVVLASFRMAVLFMFLTVFIPVWTNRGLIRLKRLLLSTTIFSRTEIPARIDDIQSSLTVTLSAAIIGALYSMYFPIACTLPGSTAAEQVSSSSETAAHDIRWTMPCYFVPRISLFFILAGIATASITLLMGYIRSRFQERTFKTHLVENRFKVFVINQLLLAAKREKLSRENLKGDTADETKGRRLSTDKSAVIFMSELPFIVLGWILRPIRRIFSIHSPAPKQPPFLGGNPNEASFSLVTGEFSEFKQQLSQEINMIGYESIATTSPRTDLEAKKMAQMIFHYLCQPDRNYLVFKDFAECIPNEQACHDAYQIFDADNDGTVTKAEFRSAIVKVFKQQRNLGLSVVNTGTVLSILDSISMAATCTGLILLFLALMGVNVQSIFAVVASIMLGLNFIIFDAANKTFQSIMFLFVVHPYDIGDRVVIGKDPANADENTLTVLHINIQNTVLKKWNGMVMSIPNHLLANDSIINLSRTDEQWERIEFNLFGPDQLRLTVDEVTQRLAELRKQFDAFVKTYPLDYYPAFELRTVIAADSARSEQTLDKLKFVLKIRCKETVDSQKKWIRHARILAFVKQSVQQVGIEFTP